MSYEHCDLHDMDATNGCSVCNGPNFIVDNIHWKLCERAEEIIRDLWAYVKKAREERDEARAELAALREQLAKNP
jgi:hypothetical protein